jgi:quercetin dioxygenase-like cupin family protein
MTNGPRVFNILRREAIEIKQTPFGDVGRVFSGEGLEAVWVSKHDEQIAPDWFSQDTVDLLLVVQGQLRVEFESQADALVLQPGDLLVLPANTRCRAYRWPRDRRVATVFVAVYPTGASSGASE